MLIHMASTDPVKSNHGFSLVELLIALLLGSLLLAMVIGLYVTCVSEGGKAVQFSRLRSDSQSIVAMLETDIRRAGYGGEQYLVGEFGDKSIDINGDQDCIVYYYNHNRTADLEHSNKMAFSLKQGVIKFKTGIGQVAETVCVNDKGWTSISDSQFMTITQLRFTESISSNAYATLRTVKIDITATLHSNNIYSHSLTTYVQVRNMDFHNLK